MTGTNPTSEDARNGAKAVNFPDKRSSISQSIDWYAEGQSRTVEVDGVRVTIRFVGRRGRRARIAIEAPAGASFSSNTLEYAG